VISDLTRTLCWIVKSGWICECGWNNNGVVLRNDGPPNWNKVGLEVRLYCKGCSALHPLSGILVKHFGRHEELIEPETISN
jgi:hypothetical protein